MLIHDEEGAVSFETFSQTYGTDRSGAAPGRFKTKNNPLLKITNQTQIDKLNMHLRTLNGQVSKDLTKYRHGKKIRIIKIKTSRKKAQLDDTDNSLSDILAGVRAQVDKAILN